MRHRPNVFSNPPFPAAACPGGNRGAGRKPEKYPFSILKRGITGTYHHVSQQHLKRYLAEFDFRYNERSGLGVSDAERTAKMLQGIVGKRLTYRRTDKRENV